MATSLPYIDEHTIRISAPRDCAGGRRALRRRGGERQPSGPRTAARHPATLSLEGRHRFAEYRLVFDLSGDGAGTTLRAVTYARFSGLRGRLYRSLVIGSRGHTLATRRILRSIKRLATP